MAKDLTFSSEARNKIISGSDKLSRAVAVTMGPQGKNVILGKYVGAPVLTKDGVSVAREITLEDPVEELSCQLIKEAAGRTATLAGDGTTTATVLTDEILKRGSELLDEGYSPLFLRRGIEKAVELLFEGLDQMSVKVSTFEDLKNIATISANNDSDLGDSIAKAFHVVDMEGTVVAEASPGMGNSVRLVNGIELNSGWISPSFLVESGQSEVTLENCKILICNEEISNIALCLKLFNELSEQNVPVLILAKNVDREVLQTLVANNKLGRLKACAVKIPVMGSAQDEWLECLAALVGTRVCSAESGNSIADTRVVDLGFAKRVVISRSLTRIIEGKKNEERVAEKLSEYDRDSKKLLSDTFNIDVRNRISFLKSKAAVISVGYSTELELREKGDRVEDAICATRAAIEEGYVPGGGTALLRASSCADLSNVDDRLLPAVKMVMEACRRPIRQILQNADLDADLIMERVLENNSFSFGYNAATNQYEDLVLAGVVDPKKVTRTALENAASIATLLINTGAVVSEQAGNPSSWQPPAGWRPPEEGKLSHKY
jgi:chaperonin GroEL